MIKRLISAVLIASLAVVYVPSVYAKDGEIFYNMTFEDGYLGIAPSGFNVTEDGNTIQTVEIENGYDGNSQRCVSFEMSDDISAGKTCRLQRSVSRKDCESFVFDWYYYPGDDVSKKQTYVRDVNSNNDYNLIEFSEDGYIVLPSDNREILCEYTGDKWYHLQCVVSCKDATFDAYVDGECIRKNCKWPVTGMPRYISFLKSYSARPMKTSYVDSIRLYSGSELMDESKFTVPARTKGYAEKIRLEAGEVFLNNTFEDQFPYTTQAGYYNTRNGNTSTLIEYEGGNAIQIASKEGAAEKKIVLQKVMSIFEGQTVFDISIKPMDTSSKAVLYIADASGVQVNPLTLDHGTLSVGGVKAGTYEADKWYRIVSKIDTDKKTINYFLNGERIGAADRSYTMRNVRSFTLTCTYEEKAMYYVDNVRVYGGTEIMDEFPEAVPNYNFKPVDDERLEGAIALFDGSPRAYCNGEKTLIDSDNEDVAPYITDGRMMIPLRFVSEAFGCDVTWNDGEMAAYITKYNKTLVVREGSVNATVGKNAYTLYAAPESKNGRLFIPLRDVAEYFEKEIFWDDMGLVVVGGNADALDSENDRTLVTNLIALLVFERPTGEQVAADMKNTIGDSHPRVMITDEQIELLREIYYTDKDPRGKRYIENVISYADKYLGATLPEYKRGSNDNANTIRNRCGSLSLARLITGDEKYLDELRRIAQLLIDFPDWDKTSGILFGETLVGVSILYDWNYDCWTEEERNALRKAMKEKGLDDIKASYEQAGLGLSSWITKTDNFNAVGSVGALYLCLVTIDDPELGEEAKWCAEKAFTGLEHSVQVLMPDGAWKEGVTYWSYTMRFLTPFLASLTHVCGTDYGILNIPGFSNTGNFMIYMQGPTGIFNFGDAGNANQAIRSGVEMFAFSDFTGDETYRRRNLYYQDLAGKSGEWLEMLFYRPFDEENLGEIDRPLDAYFDGAQVNVAAFRSSWEQDGNFIAFTGGTVGYEHSEFDVGTFVIDSQGERWAYDLGPDSYSLTDYNTQTQTFRHYRRRTESHNTILLNPSEDSGQNMSSKGFTKIKISDLNDPDCVSAVMDMTHLYTHENAFSVKRGIRLCENRSRFIIRDEIKIVPGEIYWFMHTDADVTVAKDGKSAILSKNGKLMRVTVLEDDVTLDVMDAVPLPTSPESPKQNKNEGFRKLFIHSENADEVTYTVVIDPIESESDEFIAPQVDALESW